MILGDVKKALINKLDAGLVDQLLESYEEAKQNLYLGKLRLNEVEGGRFCEAAFRILESVTKGKFTPLSRSLGNTDDLIAALASLPHSQHPDAIRLHIPRALRVVYDIRNKRDAAHLSDGIDPNLQDATLVCSILDWVLAEFVRLYHGNLSANDAQDLVEDLVTRKAPVVQNFDGFLKVLNPKLGASNFCLVILYQLGKTGAKLTDLEKWVHPKMRSNLKRTLTALVDDKAFLHAEGDFYRITRLGQQYAESERLLDPV